MRSKILELVETKPKHYTKIIKANPELSNWVTENSLVQSDHLPTMIYSAVNQITNVCENGNIKKYDRWSTGFVGCGPSSVCKCTRDNISKNVSVTKQAYTDEQNEAINEKRRVTTKEKTGYDYNSQRPEVKAILSAPKIPLITYDKLSSKEWLEEEYEIKKRSLSDIAAEVGVDYTTVGDYCKLHGFHIRQTATYSLVELSVLEYVKSLGVIDVIHGAYHILDRKQIDIYIPSKKFGIEVDGLYWHSFNPKNAVAAENIKQHVEKTDEAKQKEIDLIHITDYEWYQKTDIIKSIIKSKLGFTTKIYARKCELTEISTSAAQAFFNENHLQGFISATYYIGLKFNNELVMAISAGKSRFSNDNCLELYRMASKLNITVVGGGSKLIKYLKQKTTSKIISYCDRMKSSGAGYKAMGFELLRVSDPGYFWTDGTNIISRYKCMKKKLAEWLPSYDENLSESGNMFAAKYRRFWDCGNFVFVME